MNLIPPEEQKKLDDRKEIMQSLAFYIVVSAFLIAVIVA